MQLLHVEISKNTLGCVEALTAGVKEGHTVGCVVALLHKRRRYSIIICGEAYHDPTWADGVTDVAKAELMDLIREQGQRSTTL